MPYAHSDTNAQSNSTDSADYAESGESAAIGAMLRRRGSQDSRLWRAIAILLIVVLVVAIVVAVAYLLLTPRRGNEYQNFLASSGGTEVKQAPVQPKSGSSTTAIRKGTIKRTITATGNLKARSEVLVGSEISGIITAINVDSNDTVKKGQEVARIDDSRYVQQVQNSLASLNAAKARLGEAAATLTEAGLVLDKNKRLFAASNGETPAKTDMEIFQAAFDRATAQKNAAEAAVVEATAKHALNETDLKKTVIYSPIDGVVLKRNVEKGQTVAARFQAPELFLIAEDLRKMKLVVNVAEADIGDVRVGLTANFTVDALPGRQFKASVVKVESAATTAEKSDGTVSSTNNVVTYKTELEVPNDDLTLCAGMTAVADISTNSATPALLVPNEAFYYSPRPVPPNLAPTAPGFARIWVSKNGRAEPLDVRPGHSDDKDTIISGNGVSEGLQVFVGGK